ncbi:MAG: CehA/McbA family metallohydrolase [Bryobacteraceae bacterium]
MKIDQRIPVRIWLAAAASLFLLLALLTSDGVQAAPELHWYKGNLHTHTANSDGDSTPNDVANWYKEHRYNFLVLTDHNFRTEIDGLNAVHAAKDRFLLIPGEEVTDSFAKAPVHINGYDGSALVEPAHGQSMVETIQRNVDAIRAVNGLPSVNHPNFGWAITSKDLLEIRNLNLFEVYNGHPYVNNSGGGGVESMDELWDTLLTAGRKINGIAVDDAHHFKQLGRDRSNPGRGWVVVRAAELTRGAIRGALATGNFYASTGVELADIRSSESELRIDIKPTDTAKYRTYFIGAEGRILGKSLDNVAVYKIRGGEKYVRARVEASTGDTAWTQPIYPAR